MLINRWLGLLNLSALQQQPPGEHRFQHISERCQGWLTWEWASKGLDGAASCGGCPRLMYGGTLRKLSTMVTWGSRAVFVGQSHCRLCRIVWDDPTHHGGLETGMLQAPMLFF